MQTADFYSSATGTLRVNGGQDANAPKGVSLSVDDLAYIKQGSRANDAEPVTDYDLLDNKPQINNITLTGNKSLNDLGIQPKIDSTHKVSADNIDDSTATNKFATAEQLSQIETNQNNISNVQTTVALLVSLIDSIGGKNLINAASGTGTGYVEISCNIPAGTYAFGLSNLSGDSSETSQVLFYSSNYSEIATRLQIAKGQNIVSQNIEIPAGKTLRFIRIRAAESSETSTGLSVSYTTAFLCKQSIYSIAPTITPYSPTFPDYYASL